MYNTFWTLTGHLSDTFQTLLENSPDSFWTLVVDGTLVGVVQHCSYASRTIVVKCSVTCCTLVAQLLDWCWLVFDKTKQIMMNQTKPQNPKNPTSNKSISIYSKYPTSTKTNLGFWGGSSTRKMLVLLYRVVIHGCRGPGWARQGQSRAGLGRASLAIAVLPFIYDYIGTLYRQPPI